MNVNTSMTRGDATVAPDPFSAFVVVLAEAAVTAAVRLQVTVASLFDSVIQAATQARRRFHYHRTMATLSAVSDHVLTDIGCDRRTIHLMTQLSGEGCEAGPRCIAVSMA